MGGEASSKTCHARPSALAKHRRPPPALHQPVKPCEAHRAHPLVGPPSRAHRGRGKRIPCDRSLATTLSPSEDPHNPPNRPTNHPTDQLTSQPINQPGKRSERMPANSGMSGARNLGLFTSSMDRSISTSCACRTRARACACACVFAFVRAFARARVRVRVRVRVCAQHRRQTRAPGHGVASVHAHTRARGASMARGSRTRWGWQPLGPQRLDTFKSSKALHSPRTPPRRIQWVEGSARAQRIWPKP